MPEEGETATARIPVTPSTLRALAELAGKGTTYDEAIRKLLAAGKRFTSEEEFGRWITENLDLFGFVRVVKNSIGKGKPGPDLVLEDGAGRKVRVEIEMSTQAFVAHRHDPAQADMVFAIRGDTPLPLAVYVLGPEFLEPRPALSVYMEGPEIRRLQDRAAHERRSVSSQAALYILKGLKEDGS
jgi:hypothetical protein